MASIITPVRSVLDDLELLESVEYFSRVKFKVTILIYRLRNLRTFLLCARKLSNNVQLRSDDNNDKDASLGSLLVRIEDAVCRNAKNINPYCHSSTHNVSIKAVEVAVIDFQNDINSFEKEIDEWYITLSDCLRQTSSPMTNEVIEIIDSLLENRVDFLIWHGFRDGGLPELTEAVEEKLAFLNIFIRFSTLQGIEIKQFPTQIEAIAVNAAHLFYMCQSIKINDQTAWKQMEFKFSALLQEIKTIDPQVYQAYTQALTSSKLSRPLHASTRDRNDDTIVIMKDFIECLLCCLWEMLKLDTFIVDSMNDQWQVLYEGLRFLRNSLKEKPNIFDEKMKDLTEVVICDAGILIFSLDQKDVSIDLGILDLLERIKVIRTEVEGEVQEISTFNFPKTNELGFIDFLLENLMELTSCKANSNAQSHVQTILDEIVSLRSFLGEIVELRNEHEEIQALWNRVVEVAYKVEFLIDSLVIGDDTDSFSTSFDSITENIRNIKTDVLKIFNSKRQDIKVKKVSKTFSSVPSQSSVPVSNEFVGFHYEATSIIDRLKRGSKQLRIVAIVGMPGLGKTTLATKVYNDPSVMSHFHVRACLSVSQVFDKKKVLLELLNHIVTNLPESYFVITEQDLAEELWRRLKGSRYLIFLDDVWEIEVWNSLERSLPDDCNGSRIILTSRVSDVAPQAKLDEEPHFLRQLTNNESWELLQRKLFPGKSWPSGLYELGMQIVENCKGLPLTIVIVAGLLATMEQEGWKEILESLSSGIISSTDQCVNTLELSYKHLPDYLKSCLLYFGAFAEDEEFSVKRLIWLWIAEGFVQKTELKSLEDVATDYMMDLVGRSLVMVVEKTSMGGVKTCRIHDLLRDFFMTKAKEENFLQVLKGYDELLAFNEPHYLRRLCIHSKPEHFKKSKLFCPRVRSLLLFSQAERYERNISFIVHIFKLLTVLDIQKIHLGDVFPSEIQILIHLKYLAIQGGMTVIPSSIGNLSKLETFVIIFYGKGVEVSLPDTLWNLQKLRHLSLSGGYVTTLSLPIENLDNSSNLYELDSLSGATICSGSIYVANFSNQTFSATVGMEMLMRKFPNIRKLKCRVLRCWEDCIALDFLSRLESLHLSTSFGGLCSLETEFCFPVNLKKLTLSDFGWPWSKISMIGKLPNLVVLKLEGGSFSGKTWEMEEGELSKLRFLKLSGLDIVRWTASDDQFPYLQKLVLVRCRKLEEIPSCLENISTLEMIEVSYCSHSMASLVEQIREEQMNMGNSFLKTIIRTSTLF